MGVVLALPATGRNGQSAGQASEGAGAVLDGVLDITFSDVIADTDVHGFFRPVFGRLLNTWVLIVTVVQMRIICNK